MKVLILSDVNSSHTKKWVEGLCNSGIKIALFSLTIPTQNWFQNLENCTFFEQKKSKNFLSGKFSYLLHINTVRQITKEFKPDIVHAHYATSYGMLAYFSCAKRIFISVWGSDVFEFPIKSVIHRFILKKLLSRAEKIFSTSKIMADELTKYTAQKPIVIPFGIDTTVFKPNIHSNNSKFIIGTVKTLASIYGIDLLIQSAVDLRKKGHEIECHIYGEGPLKKEFENLIDSLHANQYIFLKGFVPHQKVPEIMNTFSVFCNFSRQESFGVAVLEASSCEIPVVATRIGGLREVVDDNETGYLADLNVTDLSSKIETLILDDEKRNEMGKKGRIWVQNKYEWNKNLNQMIEYYI